MKKLLSLLLMLLCISLGASAARCKAITLAGTQCKNKAKIEGYCTQHYKIKIKEKNNPGYDKKVRLVTDSNGRPKKATSAANRCHATTKKGTRCKLQVLPGTNYCPTHTK